MALVRQVSSHCSEHPESHGGKPGTARTCGCHHANIMFLQPKVRHSDFLAPTLWGCPIRLRVKHQTHCAPQWSPSTPGSACLSEGPASVNPSVYPQLTPGSLPGTPVSSRRPCPRGPLGQPGHSHIPEIAAPAPALRSSASPFLTPCFSGDPCACAVTVRTLLLQETARCVRVRACCVRARAWGWGRGPDPEVPLASPG